MCLHRANEDKGHLDTDTAFELVERAILANLALVYVHDGNGLDASRNLGELENFLLEKTGEFGGESSHPFS